MKQTAGTHLVGYDSKWQRGRQGGGEEGPWTRVGSWEWSVESSYPWRGGSVLWVLVNTPSQILPEGQPGVRKDWAGL